MAKFARAAVLALALPSIAAGREIKEHTPTPCKKVYDQDFVQAMAEGYINNRTEKGWGNSKKPKMWLLLGGSGSGKGELLSMHHCTHGKPGPGPCKFIQHGIDEYLELLPEYQASMADKDFVYKDAADDCYPGAIAIAKAAQKILIERRLNIVYEETGKDLNRLLKRVMPPFVDAKYTVIVTLIDCTVDRAQARAVERFLATGRYSSPEYVENSHKNVFENYLQIRDLDEVDHSIYCDNDCESTAEMRKEHSFCMRCWRDSVEEGNTNIINDDKTHMDETTIQYIKGRDGSKRYLPELPDLEL